MIPCLGNVKSKIRKFARTYLSLFEDENFYRFSIIMAVMNSVHCCRYRTLWMVYMGLVFISVLFVTSSPLYQSQFQLSSPLLPSYWPFRLLL